ncbi:probable membrane-associated kinase regulator 6 [Benincasa hispida]|uniref:probable membrane-associated kinase regulator 6 n=1 Tax=Benincasa hispida TaxID=102211 RepID=UPI0019015C8E|nr:probable membrane-associated kinase regulator 6 [Benincasa hispida]
MEASSQSLSIESFSYSWLVNMRSSFDISCGNSFRTSLDEASFIEMDPTMPPSKRFYFTNSSRPSHDFKFPALSPSPSLPLVHADQLISNGYLVPLQAYEGVLGAMIGSPDVKLTAEPPGKSESLRKCCRRLSRQIFEKYLNFLRPLCRRFQRVGGGGNCGNGKLGGKKLLFHGGTTREAHHQCFDEWRRSSCDSETSIYDAVLHCKNSIGK